jgi:hypothetical protein
MSMIISQMIDINYHETFGPSHLTKIVIFCGNNQIMG